MQNNWIDLSTGYTPEAIKGDPFGCSEEVMVIEVVDGLIVKKEIGYYCNNPLNNATPYWHINFEPTHWMPIVFTEKNITFNDKAIEAARAWAPTPKFGVGTTLYSHRLESFLAGGQYYQSCQLSLVIEAYISILQIDGGLWKMQHQELYTKLRDFISTWAGMPPDEIQDKYEVIAQSRKQ